MNALIPNEFQVLTKIKANLATCILGKKDEINIIITALLAGGHVLLEMFQVQARRYLSRH